VYLRKFASTWWRSERIGYWEKIAKRLFTLFGKIQDNYLQRHVPALLDRNPALRRPIFRYYVRLGYSRARFNQVMAFLGGSHCLDDSGLVGAADLLVKWPLPKAGKSSREVLQLAQDLTTGGSLSPAPLTAGLMLAAKYCSPDLLASIALRNTRSWRASEWASRQVAAASVRMSSGDQRQVERTMSAFGLQEGASVLAHLDELKSTSQLTPAQRAYLEHPSEPFPLPKVLAALAYIRGSPSRADADAFRVRLLQLVSDATYRALISALACCLTRA
jgi:hypothetical protein